jgi:hypothetical protein
MPDIIITISPSIQALILLSTSTYGYYWYTRYKKQKQIRDKEYNEALQIVQEERVNKNNK